MTPPQSRGQWSTARGIDVEAVRHLLAVPHDGEYGACGSRRGKSRNRRIYATDIFQCFCHSKTRLPCQSDGRAAHAAADVQQDMYSGVETSLFCLFAENARIADLHAMQ